jgi:uracil-DNA glycosylase family 4
VTDRLGDLSAAIVECRRCPRLVEWREQVALDPPRRFRGERYWAAPVPGFGDPSARIVFVGLAPGAHGANRTGRMFTGDPSGDFLVAALHRADLANQPTSTAVDDGLRLSVRLVAPVRCVPPGNRPSAAERDACADWLSAELDILPWTVGVALGSFGWSALQRYVGGDAVSFGHGVERRLDDGRLLLAAYHPSPLNTRTGRLDAGMFDAILARAVRADQQSPGPS